MSDIKAAMQLIGGVAPTPQQVQRVQAIAHSLGIAQNDPMLSILIALDVYHGVFSDLPNKAQELAETAASAAAAQAKGAVDQIVQQAVGTLTPQVEKAMGQVVSKIATRQMFQWGMGAFIVVTLAITATCWFAYSTGVEAGRSLGYFEAKDEKAAAAWANTPQGQTAFKMAKSGSLEMVASCSGKGWSLEKGICYVQPVKDKGTYGWRVP